jgi:murein DD-endopeptidase MepM/ murein hydrolase activator NlpD
MSIFFPSPREKQLQTEKQNIEAQLQALSQQVDQMQLVMADLQQRDDNLYRVLFAAEPIPLSVRQGAQRKIDYYEQISKMTNSQLAADLTMKIDMLAKELYVQSKSYDDLVKMAKTREVRMENIPAIQPILNKDLTRIASGFGARIDPVYHVVRFHQGMDFTASTGTDIYATGNGTVSFCGWRQGYGNTVIINHGFGYETLYAHCSELLVVEGQKVRRSDVVAKVGNTGKSTGPHLHYEVRLRGTQVDPRNYFFMDLSPEDYDRMVQLSNNFGRVLD